MHTLPSLKKDLRSLGLKRGMSVIVHTSFGKIGDVNGGPVGLIYALEETVTLSGNVVMPTMSANLTGPAEWYSAEVPRSRWQEIQRTMPAYDKRFSPTHKMGIVPEVFRKQRGVARSNHPAVSFAAWGGKARQIVRNHDFDFPTGKGTPLYRLYGLNGYVLLIGVDHRVNTSLHLAENLAGTEILGWHWEGSPILVNGERKWKRWRELNLGDGDKFAAVGKSFEQSHRALLHKGKVGDAVTYLLPMRDLVDYAIDVWRNEKGVAKA
jgi:aminoglycoside 3-N-acetyltransferase